MSDLTFDWKFYSYHLLFGSQSDWGASYSGDIKGPAEDVILTTNIRANAGSPLGTPAVITYKFAVGAPDFEAVDLFGPYVEEEWPEKLKAMALEVFAEVSAFTNVTFVEAGPGDTVNLPIYQVSKGPGLGDIIDFPTDEAFMLKVVPEAYPGEMSDEFRDLLWKHGFRHELGHNLGLSHPRNYGEEGWQDKPYDPKTDALPPHEESLQFSVMSYLRHEIYFGEPGTSRIEQEHGVSARASLVSYGLNDIKTLQFLYGVNAAPTAGDDIYTFNARLAPIRTIYDSGGIDTFDLRNQEFRTVINLEEASFSSIGTMLTFPQKDVLFDNNVSIAWDTVIENVIGSDFDDVIKGNHAANDITGGGGRDTLSGAAGSDTLSGGDGDDQLWAGKTDDAADHMLGGAGDDQIGGGFGDDTLEGGAGRDVIFGGDGHDRLLAGSDEDSLFGGLGDDTILGEGGSDLIYGGKGVGNDRVTAGDGDDTLYAGQGTDVVDGGAGADLIFAGSGDDSLAGGDGADVLWGGAGDDLLAGGEGSDRFAFVSGFGNDHITDFSVTAGQEDRLDFSAIDGLSLAQIVAASTFDGGDTRLELTGHGTLTLTGIDEDTFQTLVDGGQILGG